MNWLDLDMTRVFETFKNSHNINNAQLNRKNYASVSLEDVKNIETILLKIKIANPELKK